MIDIIVRVVLGFVSLLLVAIMAREWRKTRAVYSIFGAIGFLCLAVAGWVTAARELLETAGPAHYRVYAHVAGTIAEVAGFLLVGVWAVPSIWADKSHPAARGTVLALLLIVALGGSYFLLRYILPAGMQ